MNHLPIDDKYILQYLINSNNIILDDVLEEINMTKNQEILKSHAENQNVWIASNGRYCTYLPDDSKPKNRKLVAKSSMEKLNQAIIDFYKARDTETTKKAVTLESFYKVWLDYKSLYTTATTSLRRIDDDWRKYYLGTAITKIPLVELDYNILDEWAHTMVKERELTKKQYFNFSIIIRQGLQYAVDKHIIDSNPFANVRIKSKLFRPVKQPVDSTQVFLIQEQPQIVSEAFKDFSENNTTSGLAIALMFELGIRVGEVLGLKFSDIFEVQQLKYIHIQRMEVKVETADSNGKWLKTTYEVVNHTKSTAGDRSIYLTKEAVRILDMVKTWNNENNFADSEYIFMDTRNGKTHTRHLAYRIQKYCKKIGIQTKSLHKIRKTFISTLIDSNNININTVKKIAGHTDSRVTLNSYVYSRKNDSQTALDIENALHA